MGRGKAPYTRLVLPALCVACGASIEHPARADKRYCSAACRVWMWRKRHAPQTLTRQVGSSAVHLGEPDKGVKGGSS